MNRDVATHNSSQRQNSEASAGGGLLGQVAQLRQTLAAVTQENQDLRRRLDEQELDRRATRDLGRDRGADYDEEPPGRRGTNRDMGRDRGAYYDGEPPGRRATRVTPSVRRDYRDSTPSVISSER